MKNTLKLTLFLAAAFMLTGAFGASAQRFAFIDTRELLDAMPEMETVDSRLQAYQEELGEMLESIQVEYNNKFNDYQKGLNTFTDSVRQLKEKELQDLSVRFTEFQQTAQQDYQKMQNDLITPVLERAREAIEAVAANQQVAAVFDLAAGSLVYQDTSVMLDLLPLVKQHLGI